MVVVILIRLFTPNVGRIGFMIFPLVFVGAFIEAYFKARSETKRKEAEDLFKNTREEFKPPVYKRASTP